MDSVYTVPMLSESERTRLRSLMEDRRKRRHGKLTPEQRDALVRRLLANPDLRIADVAEEVGLTRYGVYKLLARAVAL